VTRASPLAGRALAVLLAPAVACADPTYRTAIDAGKPEDVAVDGAVDAGVEAEAPAKITEVANNDTPNRLQSDASVDAGAWWSSLAEHYAVRMRFFGHDRLVGNAAWLSHEIIMLAHLRPNAEGELDMELRRCRDHGYLDSDTLPIVDDWEWLHAQDLPPEQHRLVLRDGKVQSEAAARLIGYQDEPACTPGAQLSFPERSWLPNGKCDCASDPLPLLPTDCRVIDADGDSEAGFTVRRANGDVQNVRAKDNCQIVDGVIEGGRIRASYVENYDYLELSCWGPCRHNDIIVCPVELNEVLFEPISAQRTDSDQPWDCEGLLKVVDAGKVFPSKMLSFPPSCVL
jgi:hypothetical protein